MKPDCKYFDKCSVNDCSMLNDSHLETLPDDPETVCKITGKSRVMLQKTMINTMNFDGILRLVRKAV